MSIAILGKLDQPKHDRAALVFLIFSAGSYKSVEKVAAKKPRLAKLAGRGAVRAG
jgi:hypothetical protein